MIVFIFLFKGGIVMKKLFSIILVAFLIISGASITNSGKSNAEGRFAVSRTSGPNRYATAYFASSVFINKNPRQLGVIAYGDDFKTALSASYMATALEAPYFIYDNKKLPQYTIDDMKRLGVKKIYIVGDYSKVNKKLEQELRNININYERLYLTESQIDDGDSFDGMINWKIAKILYGDDATIGDTSSTILINKDKFADLLSVVPFAGITAGKYGYYLFDYPRDIGDNIGWEYGFIIGGYNSVPKKFRAVNYPDGFNPVNSRISGRDRYLTAIQIAKKYKMYFKTNPTTVVLVDGTRFPDALSSGVVANAKGGVVLLTQPNKLNKDTRDYLVNNKNIKEVIIIGGEKSVSNQVYNELLKIK